MRSATVARVGRTAALLLAVGFLFSLFLLAVRPWYQHWGATSAEANASLPGDEFLHATPQSTRAVSIDAPIEQVWPWLAQIGQDRGGFYSYELLEDLVGTDMENLNILKPQLQHWKVGDKLWMYPPDKLHGAGHAKLLRIDPGRALVFATRQIGTGLSEPYDGTWTFILRPIDAQHTRLIVRGRAPGGRSLALEAFNQLVFEPMHFVMERKMMEGLKARAEGSPLSPMGDLIEVVVFMLCFGLFVAAALRLICWPDSLPELVIVLATGFAFQLITFVQPPWIVGALIVAILGVFVGNGSLTARRQTDSGTL